MGEQGMAGKHQASALTGRQAPLHEGQVGVRIIAIQLVAHQWMAEVSEVDAHLVGSARVEPGEDEGERESATLEPVLHAPSRPGG
jgi:hypothetical protein